MHQWICDRPGCRKPCTVRYRLVVKLAKADDVLTWDLCRECVDLVTRDHGLNRDTGRETTPAKAFDEIL